MERSNVLRFLVVFLLSGQLVYAQEEDDRFFSTRAVSKPCALKVVDASSSKFVCVCNTTYCDNLVVDWPTKQNEYLLVQSTRSGLRFNQTLINADNKDSSSDSSNQEAVELRIDLADEYQKIMGFGGAFTDSTGINIKKLPRSLGRQLVEDYYGEYGSQYTFGRVPISGTDFSARNYSYDDRPGYETDFELKHWSLQYEDYNYKIPFIKLAQRLSNSRKGELKLFASTWSPPAFMKTSHSLVGGHLIGTEQVYRSYAQYLAKFYQAYARNGIQFWGATVQNEPTTGYITNITFNSLEMFSGEAIELIGNYLGPALADIGLTKDKFKLMITDGNMPSWPIQVREILSSRKAREFVSGLAYHWYTVGVYSPYNALNETYDSVQDSVEFMLMTEACNMDVDLGSWENGEKYASAIIKDLQRQTAGWIDWNLALDERGGPNWVSNFVDSPVIVNGTAPEYYKQPMYYVLAQFSRFFRPNSVRVGASFTADNDQLLAVAVHKKDSGHLAVNILNQAEDGKLVRVSVANTTRDVPVQGKSLTTLIVKL